MIQLNLNKDRVYRPKPYIEKMALWLRGSDRNYTYLYNNVLEVRIFDETVGVKYMSNGIEKERDHYIGNLDNAQLFRVTREEKEYFSFRQLGSSQKIIEEI